MIKIVRSSSTNAEVTDYYLDVIAFDLDYEKYNRFVFENDQKNFIPDKCFYCRAGICK